MSQEFRKQAQATSADWERIARALLAGYADNVFVSMKELKDRVHRFVRYNKPDEIAVLDLQSTLTRAISATPVSIVLARDIRHSTAVRATAVLSFIGEIKPAWLESSMKRQFTISSEEETYLNTNNRFSSAQSTFSNKINLQMSNGMLTLDGPVGTVLNAELHLRQQMVDEMKFSLTAGSSTTTEANSNFSRNLQSVPPRILRPQMRKDCRDIEERIARVTDSSRTLVDLYNSVKGSKATRETRMEAVGWIAVCKFNCKVEGGFVRDWIVGHYAVRPASKPNPKDWIELRNGVPYMNMELVPADLDCHLPSHAYFDIDRFEDELYKFGISCKVLREDWRYVLLLDENADTGPFTMDLIEPHVALTHDRIDFDVSNLALEKDYTHELGMRIDIEQKPYSIDLESIVDNIKNKRFRILRPIDAHLQQRIDKMVKRGWTQMGEPLSVIPSPPPKHYVVLVPLSSSAILYNAVSTEIKKISGVQIISIEEIKNPYLEETYEGMRKLIGKQCKNLDPNEQLLFHGTKSAGIEGIPEDGYDDRYFVASGAWGK
ncbi:unnamed protein product [Rotaria sp. Silwood1]|nr:unnamed protein product [Rotaria sp. Silwood1]